MTKSSTFAWLFFFLIYLLNFYVASQSPEFPFEEALGSLVIVGIFFLGIAYLLVRKSSPLRKSTEYKQGELFILIGILVYASVGLIFGNKSITDWIPDYFPDSLGQNKIITLTRKVIIFVAIPFFMYKYLLGFGWKDFGLSTNTKENFSARDIMVFVVMSLIFFLIQWFGGRQARPIRSGEFSGLELIVGLPLAFLWLYIEVGLVEEFFFRALIQDRISASTNSFSWGIVIASLLYGLAHVPGIYLRKAGVVDGLSANPSFIFTVCYCISVQATVGLPLGIIWSKTRNLYLMMALRASLELLSHYPSLMKYFWK